MSPTNTKETILNAAEQLFFTKGYDATSIQMIIDAVGIAKGTFYHHFKSKEELLIAYTEKRTEPIYALIEGLIEGHPEWNAVELLNNIFQMSSVWKSQNKEIMTVMLQGFYRKENQVLVAQVQEKTIEAMGPYLTRVVERGIQEGLFHTAYPEEMGPMIMRLGSTMSTSLGREMLNPTPDLTDKMIRAIEVYEESIERLLGAEKGVIHLADKSVIIDMCQFIQEI